MNNLEFTNIFNIISIINLMISVLILLTLKSYIPEAIGFIFTKKKNIYLQRLSTYQEMIEVISISRKAASELVINPNNHKTIRDFNEATNHLTINLYKYRIFIHSDTYSELHQYKRLLQDFQTYLDTINRNSIDIQEKAIIQEKLKDIYSKIEEDHTHLIQKIKSKADSNLK